MATPAGGSRADSRPPATLYVHLSSDALVRDTSGVACFEGVGPITTDQAKEFIGHCNVTTSLSSTWQ
jgi:hypothetical protein